MAEQATRGQIGVEIFEQVEKMVAETGINRTEAFQRISEESGRRPGTVAANYYRVARQRGTTLLPRGGRGRRRNGAATDVDAALARAIAAVEELATVARANEEELGRLREQSQQLDKLRKMLG